MARTILDTQLQSITSNIIHLGELVEKALEQSLQAIPLDDQALCGLIVASDTEMDDFRHDADRMAFQSLTLQQPLGGRDLRFLSSVPSISSDLERTGDNAVGIAKLLLRMSPLRKRGVSTFEIQPSAEMDGDQQQISDHAVSEDSIIKGILTLGQEAQSMLQKTMDAFSNRDAKAARAVLEADDEVDEQYSTVRLDLMSMLAGIHTIPALQHDGLIMQRMSYWLWIAHDLERVGDHCTNICERIIFFVEGSSVTK